MFYYYVIKRSRAAPLDKSISKLYLLDLDPLLSVVKPFYLGSECRALRSQEV